jgi:DNA-binding protein WhiA
MSFAQEVKKEITTLEASNEEYKAELYGITKLKVSLIISNNALQMEYVTRNISLARRMVFLLKRLYETDVELMTKEQKKLDYKKLYYVLVKERAKDILFDLDIIDENMSFRDEVSTKYDHLKDSVLRGMFLGKGSINDPNKSNYHLEIVCNYPEEGNYIVDMLKEYGIIAKLLERPKGIVVYIKKGEQIGDFLKVVGTSNMLFYFENERIKRDLNNVVNRILNCDMANGDRTQASALRQLEDIKLIEETKGYAFLSTRLMEAVILRTTYPDSSLAELSELSEETIGRNLSKSGISHCLKDLEIIAASLRKNKK